MKLSTKTRYGLRILVQIALDSVENSPVKGNVIAQKQEISEPYLEQIMIPLKNSGLVGSLRGCNGGYILNRETDDINLLEVIELFEGELQLVRCTDMKHKCSRLDKCPNSKAWNELSEVLRKKAAEISLSEIIKNVKIDLKSGQYNI